MLIRETFVNATRGYQYGDTGWYEPFTDNRARLFLALQREYGRCISKMYCEPDGKQVGWVFEKKVEWGDCKGEYYTQETWVEIATDHLDFNEAIETLEAKGRITNYQSWYGNAEQFYRQRGHFATIEQVYEWVIAHGYAVPV